jgi:hypothetical protein
MAGRSHLSVVDARREPLLANSGGGPHDPGMEARIARLEEDFRAMRADVSATRADVSYIRGRLETLPTTWQMIATVLGGFVALVGAVLGAVRLFGH